MRMIMIIEKNNELANLWWVIIERDICVCYVCDGVLQHMPQI